MTVPPAGTSCTLNGVIIDIKSNAVLQVGIQRYVDEEQLRSVRTDHRATHFVKREGDNIISVPLLSDIEPIGNKVEKRELQKSSSLVGPLVLEALIRYFHTLGRPIWRHKPLRMVSSKGADQLLRQAIPKGVHIPGWLEQRVSYIFDTRTVYPENTPPAVLLACDVKMCNFISAPCSILIEAGIPVVGHYVQMPSADGDPRLSPRPRLVGRVAAIDGDTLVLTDHVEDFETVPAHGVFLEPRYENLKLCIQHLAPDSASHIMDQMDVIASGVNGGPERLRRIQSIFDHLRTVPLELAPGIEIGMGRLLRQGSKLSWFPKKEIIKKPPLIFSPLPGRTDTWNERGLDKHGPYDQRQFTPKRPRIAVVCQAEAQGQVEQFVRKFLEGMPSVTTGRGPNTRQPYGQGFIRRYALEGVDTTVFATANASAEAYRVACRRAIEHATNRGQEWTLALVQIDDSFHGLSGDENPYFVTKAVFMKHHIPVQEVTIEKMTAPGSDLVYIMNDISLATYAKMNGIPWLLSADTTIAHELVIGLGSYHVSGSRIGAKERVVGITTVFTGDGRYLLESRTAAIPYDEYATAMLDTLRLAVQTVRRDQNWQERDQIRLIFHAFKPFKDTEVAAVRQVMLELGLPHAEYAFIHVVDDHPFLAFDVQNSGAHAPGGAKKGAFAPERGTALKFTRDEVLVSFTGSRELKQPTDGMPKPALLRLHRDSTFKDMTYLARQAFAFSCHSWRGFSSAPLPITIMYSQLIAKLLRNLDEISDWDADAMLGKIGRTRWFLY